MRKSNASQQLEKMNQKKRTNIRISKNDFVSIFENDLKIGINGPQLLLKEFYYRLKKMTAIPLRSISFQDLTIIIRTLEALERTRQAKMRTWFAGVTILLGALGLFFFVIRILLL